MDGCSLALSLATNPFLRDNGSRIGPSHLPAAIPLMTADDRDWRKAPAMPLPVLSALIRRGKEGDEGAMERIYEQFKRPLFNLAYRYTPDHASAEDLLQDIFVKVFAHLEEVNRDETFVAWMYRIAINTCYSYLRSRRNREGRSVGLGDIEGKREEAVFNGHEDSLAGPLDEAIRALPEKLRAVFTLLDVQGHTHEEIGRILGVTTGTSKSQLFKARLRIRSYLKERRAF